MRSNLALSDQWSVASLGFVSPRADHWGCYPIIFSWKKLTTFLLISVSFIDFTGVSPPEGCHPAPIYLSDLVCPLFFVNLATKNFLRVSPPPSGFLQGVTRGGPPSDVEPSDELLFNWRTCLLEYTEWNGNRNNWIRRVESVGRQGIGIAQSITRSLADVTMQVRCHVAICLYHHWSC